VSAELSQRLAFIDQIWKDKGPIAEDPVFANSRHCSRSALSLVGYNSRSGFLTVQTPCLAFGADFCSAYDPTQLLVSCPGEPLSPFRIIPRIRGCAFVFPDSELEPNANERKMEDEEDPDGLRMVSLWSLDSHCGVLFDSWILCNIIQQPIEPDERMDKYECELRGRPKPLTPDRVRTSTAFQVRNTSALRQWRLLHPANENSP